MRLWELCTLALLSNALSSLLGLAPAACILQSSLLLTCKTAPAPHLSLRARGGPKAPSSHRPRPPALHVAPPLA